MIFFSGLLRKSLSFVTTNNIDSLMLPSIFQRFSMDFFECFLRFVQFKWGILSDLLGFFPILRPLCCHFVFL